MMPRTEQAAGLVVERVVTAGLLGPVERAGFTAVAVAVEGGAGRQTEA